MASVREVVAFADSYLRIGEIEDWPNALNGLQIENSGSITKIGAAVDASTHTFRVAAEREIDFLIVHHGLFWSGLQPVAGVLYRQLKLALESDIALYSVHLPLDLHSDVGNNALLARALGFETTEPFLETKGQLIGQEDDSISAAGRTDREAGAKFGQSYSMRGRRSGGNASNRNCHRRRRFGNLRSGGRRS